ncbi:hypothetical protein LOTGIDRAFT_228789 [Lottia gigantea]|uniref:Nucleolar complex protein 2 homolog n=1 Tax=Lottia gigantea TaxID=225164 RepID=V3ZJ81_LOTGI|nr:hypothetical protein LOTGIDRAFT_228789 [Lottia gigantea]ESO91328.1 hypothetical protein LOTGIDRAFT_228789 [Lottia gigantea]
MEVDDFMKYGFDSSDESSSEESLEKVVVKPDTKIKKKDKNAKKKIKAEPKATEKCLKPKQKTLDRLKEQDPEFFKFLQSEDKELLEDFESGDDESDDDDKVNDDDDNDEEDEDLKKFEEDILAQSDDDDERDSDEEQFHKPLSKLEVASDESDDDSGDEMKETSQIRRGEKQVSLTMIKQWNENIQKQPTIGVFREMVQAFKAAVRSTSKSDEVTIYHVEGGVVFNGIVKMCLMEIVPALQQLLHQPNLQSLTEVPSLSKGKNWSKIKASVKSYLVDLLKLISSISEPAMINVLLKHLHKMVPLCSVFVRIAKKLVKKCIEIWSTGEETSRVLAFLCINKMIGLLSDHLLEPSLKQMYLAFVKNCKFTSPTTLPLINFMQLSLVEIFLIDSVLAYQYAFIYIRQLAIHLRNAITVKKKETVQAVYNWQFIHCIGLWVKLLGTSSPSDVLQPLIYPLTQTIIGTAKLQPTSKFYPLSFHCVRALTLLSDTTNTYIPVLPFLLEDSMGLEEGLGPSKRIDPVNLKDALTVGSEGSLVTGRICDQLNFSSLLATEASSKRN